MPVHRRIIRILLIIIASVLFSVFPAAAAENEKVDYLGVAAVLIRDGNYSRAEKTLNKIDPDDGKTDRARYFTLLGLVQLRRADNEAAVRSFTTALDEGVDDPVIHAYLAQAWFSLGEYRQTIESIDRLPSINQFPDLYGIKSQAYWFMEDTANAFAVIETGIKRFPAKSSFLHQKIFYLVELDLNQAAVEESMKFLKMSGNSDPEAYLTVAGALRGGGEAGYAASIMEIAKILFPDNQRVRLMLAQCYADSARYLTAARIVEEASVYDPAFVKDAGELYRQAGELDRAEYLNTLIDDQADKTRLRFNILLDRKEYEEALALETRMQRTGLLQQEEMIYAMAYVCFQVQRYDRAADYLNRINSSELFRQAAKLRQAIEIMKAEPVNYFQDSSQ